MEKIDKEIFIYMSLGNLSEEGLKKYLYSVFQMAESSLNYK